MRLISVKRKKLSNRHGRRNVICVESLQKNQNKVNAEQIIGGLALLI